MNTYRVFINELPMTALRCKNYYMHFTEKETGTERLNKYNS